MTARAVKTPDVAPAKTHCKRGHKLKIGNLYTRPDGRQDCRTCIRASKRDHSDRKLGRQPGAKFFCERCGVECERVNGNQRYCPSCKKKRMRRQKARTTPVRQPGSSPMKARKVSFKTEPSAQEQYEAGVENLRGILVRTPKAWGSVG